MANKFYLGGNLLSGAAGLKKTKKFAFLVHPRISVREDMGKVFWPFYFVPEIILQKIIPHLNPIVGGKVTFSDIKEIVGWIVVIPLLAEQILSFPQEFVFKKIIKAIEMAKGLGAEVVGLGEFIASVTRSGEDLVGKVRGVSIINGKALTVGSIFRAVEEISKIKEIDLAKEKVAVVGAAGSVGRGASLLFAEKGIPLILIDKEQKIQGLKSFFSSFNNIVINNEISSIKEAKIVVVATSSTGQLIKPNYLKEGAIVYDITQPRNTSPKILKERKDITIIDGGVIDTPAIDYGVDIGLKKHQAYACLAETIICASEGIEESHIGYVDSKTADKMLTLMEKYQNYFKLNISQSFGKSLKNKLELIN